MAARLVWLALATGVAILCVPRPGVGRIFAGVFFWLTAPGVNARLAFPNPQALVDLVNGVHFGFYRDWFAPVVAWRPRPIALAAAGFAPVVGGVILGRGRAVTAGLVGATIFLLGV
ncbi:MAG TPA: hypothetical protein VFN57_05455, partial [Thermomicrobiaceae bacterium]|nr:hypothetical protein [Thermomicrobiaceae bacterium]